MLAPRVQRTPCHLRDVWQTENRSRTLYRRSCYICVYYHAIVRTPLAGALDTIDQEPCVQEMLRSDYLFSMGAPPRLPWSAHIDRLLHGRLEGRRLWRVNASRVAVGYHCWMTNPIIQIPLTYPASESGTVA